MIRNLLFVLASCVVFACNSNNNNANNPASSKDSNFSLKLKIDGFANDQVKMLGIYGEQNYLVDSAQADAQGNILIEKDTVVPTGMYFILFPDNSYFEFLVDDQQFTLEADKADIVGTLKATNSIDNELLYKNKRFEEDIQKKFDAVKEKLDKAEEGSDEYEKYKAEQDKLVEQREEHIQWFVDNHPDAFFTKFKVAGQNPKLKKPLTANGEVDEQKQIYLYRNEFWDNVDFSSPDILRTPVYYNKLNKFIKELTPQTPDSVVKYAEYITQKSLGDKELFKYTANWIALQYQKPKIMGMEKVYVHMIDKYWTYDRAYWSDSAEIKGLRQEVNLMKPSLIGKTGQDVRAKNEHDEYISLYDLDAPIVVLYIFSYECENCQKQTPKLVKVYNEWKDKGVDVFTISIDNDKEQWKQYLKKNNMTFHNVFDFSRESRYHRKYHIDVTPEMYVLNKDHKIIASNIDSKQLPAIFEKELEKNQ